MSSTTRFLMFYALLVAIPVIGAFAVLHFGQRLSAPAPVKGSWTLHFNGEPSRALLCEPGQDAQVAVHGESSRLDVTQSGQHIRLALTSPESGAAWSLQGELRQSALRARGQARLHTHRTAQRPILLSARVEGTEASRMVGRVEFPACPLAEPLPFVATRTIGSSPS